MVIAKTADRNSALKAARMDKMMLGLQFDYYPREVGDRDGDGGLPSNHDSWEDLERNADLHIITAL